MADTNGQEKRIISFVALILFAAGVFFWAVLPMLRSKTGIAPANSSNRAKSEALNNKYAEGGSCTSVQYHTQEQGHNDTLFIGCNGFF